MWYGVQNMSKYDIDIKVQPLKQPGKNHLAILCKLLPLPMFLPPFVTEYQIVWRNLCTKTVCQLKSQQDKTINSAHTSSTQL